VPAGTPAHVPFVVMLQALHGPQLATPQHTPSVQKVELHWSLPVQGAPAACCGTHVPPTPVQYVVPPQSVSLLHVVRQAATPLHTYGEQSWGGLTQLPPWQVPA
jgi:hypothetical protein